jgi:hypothetical protein
MLSKRALKQKNCEALNWSNKIDDPIKFRQVGLKLIARYTGKIYDDELNFLAALASDLVLDKKKRLQPTLLDLTSGKQGFLSSLSNLSSAVDADSLREALCGPWRYQDESHSLGWDPQTQRLHALRGKLPEADKQNRSVAGAVFLASQALPLLPSFAARGKLRTVGFHVVDSAESFIWPIWTKPISADTLRCLLSQPLDCDLKRRGVEIMYRCGRVRTGGSEGNYQIFSNAVEYNWRLN